MGKLIVLEGIDGAGKSTMVEKTTEYLESRGERVKFYHFPMYGHNEFSKIIAAYLRGDFGELDEVNPYFVANAYAMDRFLFKPELEESLSTNDVVVLDRYVLSNIAFQSIKASDPAAMRGWIHALEYDFLKLPRPDLELVIDCDPGAAFKRSNSRKAGDDRIYLNGKRDIHETNAPYQSRVHEAYREISREHNHVKLVEAIGLAPAEIFSGKIRPFLGEAL